MIQVSLHGLAGETRKLEMEGDADALRLKQEIAVQMHVPLICQKLISHNVVVSNTSKLTSYCADGSSVLSLTLLMSLDEVYSNLNSEVPDIQVAALMTLAELSLHAGEVAVAAVIARFQDKDYRVRLVALKTLPKIAQIGDRCALEASILCLSRGKDERAAAVDAIGKLANKGDERTVHAIRALLDDRGVCTQCAAFYALSKVATVEDVLIAVKAQLEDTHTRVRTHAVKALAKVAERGDTRAVALVLTRLGDTAHEVRIAVIKALVLLAAKDDKDAVAAVTAHLEDPNADVQSVAEKAMAVMAKWNDKPKKVASRKQRCWRRTGRMHSR